MSNMMLEKEKVQEVLLLLKNCFDEGRIRKEKTNCGIRLELTVGDFIGLSDTDFLYTAQNKLNKKEKFFEVVFDFINESPFIYVDGTNYNREKDVTVAYLYGKNVNEIKKKIENMLKAKTYKKRVRLEYLPKDFKWEKLKIIYNGIDLKFSYEGTTLGEISMNDLGIRKTKNGKGIYGFLLTIFYKEKNQNADKTKISSKVNANQANKKNLKRILCNLFNATSDPFIIDKDPNKTYIPKFKASFGGDLRFNDHRSGTRLNENYDLE